jgi:hypothetical protein
MGWGGGRRGLNCQGRDQGVIRRRQEQKPHPYAHTHVHTNQPGLRRCSSRTHALSLILTVVGCERPYLHLHLYMHLQLNQWARSINASYEEEACEFALSVMRRVHPSAQRICKKKFSSLDGSIKVRDPCLGHHALGPRSWAGSHIRAMCVCECAAAVCVPQLTVRTCGLH